MEGIEAGRANPCHPLSVGFAAAVLLSLPRTRKDFRRSCENNSQTSQIAAEEVPLVTVGVPSGYYCHCSSRELRGSGRSLSLLGVINRQDA